MSVPILMYHAVPEVLEPGLSPVHVQQAVFGEQMRWLFAAGYRTLSLEQLLAILHEGTPTPARTVVLTFDDGYRSLLTHVTPLLAELGFQATLFVTTGAVGSPSYGSLPGAVGYPQHDPPLSWAELAELQGSGCWSLQAHGRYHLVHNSLPLPALWREMAGAAQDLYANLGIRPRYYAYPYGRYDTRCLLLLARLGYTAACSVHVGLAGASSDLRRLPRVGVTGDDTLAIFQAKVRTGHAHYTQRLRAKVLAPIFYFSPVKDALKAIHDYFIFR
jgi:peptidoglycan/xylan/chitin deacetylase (PgdA/CDA1 family)